MHTYQEALELILAESRTFGVENIALEDASNRIIAQNITSDRDYPPFNRAAMDGYCFQIWENEILDSYKCIDSIFAGESSNSELQKGECFKIMTGAAVPFPANCIIKVEDAIEINEYIKFSIESVKHFQNIAKQGEDLKINTLLKTTGKIINSRLSATLASLGKKDIEVFKRPKVAIISTGNEIKPINVPINDNQIRDSNSYTVSSFLNKFEIKPNLRLLVKDDRAELTNHLTTALENDIIIISGGVSAGDADFVPSILTQLGVSKIFHKVRIKPGKPIWFGKGQNGQLVFALPGNPFSVQVACRIFIEPFLRKCFGINTFDSLRLPLAVDKKKKVNMDEFYPCKIINDTTSRILPLFINGSGDITAGLESDGIGLHPISETDMQKETCIHFFQW